jgi:hypothetical protein
MAGKAAVATWVNHARMSGRSSTIKTRFMRG